MKWNSSVGYSIYHRLVDDEDDNDERRRTNYRFLDDVEWDEFDMGNEDIIVLSRHKSVDIVMNRYYYLVYIETTK